MIGEEYVVKVTANTSPMKKEIRKLRKEINKSFNIQSSKQDIKALEDAFDHFNSAVIAGSGDWANSIKEVNTAVKNTFKSLKDVKNAWGFDSIDTKTIKQQLRELRKEKDKTLSMDAPDKEDLVAWKKKGLEYTPDQVVNARLIEKYSEETFKAWNDNGGRAMSAEYFRLKDQYKSQLQEFSESYSNQPTKYQLMERQKELQAKANPTDDWNKTLMAGRDKQTGEPFVPESVRKAREELAEVNKALEDRLQKEKAILGIKAKLSEYDANEMNMYKDMTKDQEAWADSFNKDIEAVEEKTSGFKGVLQAIAKPFQAIGNRIKNFFKNMWNTIKAMGKRLIVFAGLRGITQWIKEGTQNLYEWSKYNKKEWADIFDKSKSTSVALGNAISVTLNYLIMGLRSLFNEIKGGLIDFFNWVSRGLAQLFQKDTAVQARKDIMVKWADNNAETRQLIQGFDDLNIWKGNDNTLPQDMFYEVEINKKKAKDIGKEMGENFVSYVLSADPTFIGGAGGSATEEKPSFWANIRDFFVGLWEGIKLGWGKVKEWFNGILQKIKTWWNGVTDEDEGDNGETISRVVEPGFKHALSEWFNGVWNKVKVWFVGDESRGVDGIWQSKIQPFLQGVFDSLKATLVSLPKTIWDWFNGKNGEKNTNPFSDEVLEATKNSGWTGEIAYYFASGLKSVYEWMKGLDAERFKGHRITLNATGGVYTTPTLGLVGEASTKSNPELITPQSLLDDRINEGNRNLLSSISQIAGQIIEAINGVDMSVSIGDEVIARSAARGNNAYYKMMGRPLIR